jgi:ABC-type multidrug transport system fused ATPase/permease subunit
MENATFSWNDKSSDNSSSKNEDDVKKTFALENINFRSQDGQPVAVIGAVGSGKSSFINAILGNLHLCEGESKRNSGCIAYCAQQPWIQNLTLRDNVLFGSNYEEVREHYERAVRAAALIPDFNQLPSNDLTEIGERGINLVSSPSSPSLSLLLLLLLLERWPKSKSRNM